ncbi:unnamed protein product [Penicillium nalgiovense]|uniref:Uncharacterized protein n=2 Tax=Penicillium TaxID=5073 RepID=A0A1V6WXZ1_PENNA|nr:hypothetical protein PENNAL_c0165G02356 [Penicillium nalgiovense]CAG7936759.1 unnamed protein product [Penicillium salamii]CAG7967954.1 unnamed protein product [Penicillium salamii]CAG7968150.1 unnamed protein product [Penicillium salamii]CAG8002275.1 unnamed protein product [Penicillium nalgiovense]
MEKLSAAIAHLRVLKLEPWDLLHVRQRDDRDDQEATIGARGWNLEISLDEMKSSIFGCAFILDHGGRFWSMIFHTLQNWRNPEWKPLSGTDGLRVGSKTQKGLVLLCPVFYGNTHSLVPFSMLEMTTPGQIMIWQAENPVTQYTLQLKAKLLLQIIKAALIGNWKIFRRLALDFAICGQQVMLIVIVIAMRLVNTMWERSFANSFEPLE